MDMDWQTATCAQCAWAMDNGPTLFCRRAVWGYVGNIDGDWNGELGDVGKTTPACPGYVPRRQYPDPLDEALNTGDGSNRP